MMIWGGRWEGGSGLGTHVHLWWIHVSVWQNQYCIVMQNKVKIKIKKNLMRNKWWLFIKLIGIWHSFFFFLKMSEYVTTCQYWKQQLSHALWDCMSAGEFGELQSIGSQSQTQLNDWTTQWRERSWFPDQEWTCASYKGVCSLNHWTSRKITGYFFSF